MFEYFFYLGYSNDTPSSRSISETIRIIASNEREAWTKIYSHAVHEDFSHYGFRLFSIMLERHMTKAIQ